MAEENKEELRNKLTKEAFEVTQNGGTEPAFTGPLLNEKRAGTYKCVCCSKPLFLSETKFESGTGWPSFNSPMDDSSITELTDRSYGMIRTEVRCEACDAHLGHVFPDGPAPTGQRYCINSAALEFDAD